MESSSSSSSSLSDHLVLMARQLDELDALLLQSSKADVDRIRSLITTLKKSMVRLPTFQSPITGTPLPHSPESHTQLSLIIRILESASVFAILNGELDAFERSFSQLASFYPLLGSSNPSNPSSSSNSGSKRNLLLAARFLHLLSANRIGELHTALELVDGSIRAADPYLSFVVQIDELLMEGAYNKVLSTCKNAPNAIFTPFLSHLTATVRAEVASCIESSYKTLRLDEAATMLWFESAEQVLEFCEQRSWSVDAEGIRIVFAETFTTIAEAVPTEKLIADSLAYAKELESVI